MLRILGFACAAMKGLRRICGRSQGRMLARPGGSGLAGLLMLLSALVLGACSSDGAASVHQKMHPIPATELADNTAQMVDTLAYFARTASVHENGYINLARAAYLRDSGPPADPERRVQWMRAIGRELLRGGKTREALSMLIAVADSSRRYGVPEEQLFDLYEQIAVGYMRLGEQENCILNHSAASCLFPIRADGVHQKREGSEAAAKMFSQLLARQPDNLAWLWLLNLAHMTLGHYPGEMPAQWRIPPETFASDNDIGRFRDVAPAVGLAHRALSGGGITEDFDGDGDLDVLASSWGLRDQIHFFANNGDGTFSKRTEEAGLTGITGGLNMVHADYDNDGDADVLVLRGAWLRHAGHHPNSLLRNNGDGTFSDVTLSAGLWSLHPTQTAAWGDYDNDGDLDLFIGNESTGDETHRSELFRNDGDGTFTEVAGQAGVAVAWYVKAAVWGDVDNDRDLDLFLSIRGGSNRLYENAGDGTFRDVTQEAGVEEPIPSFPAWFFDYDNDGDLDLFVSGYSAGVEDVAADYLARPHDAAFPRLYKNRGDGTFEDATLAAGLDEVMLSMGSNYGDLDNDGYLDFYVGTGDPDLRMLVPNRMFRNDRGAQFEEITSSGGFGHLQKGHGVSFADLDNDGDQDVHAVMGGAYEGDVYQNVLFENPGHDRRFVKLLLQGTQSNRSAVGARLHVEVEEASGSRRAIHRVVGTGGSFGGSPLRQEIGLGEAVRIAKVEVWWPTTGERERFEGVSMDGLFRLVEGSGRAEPLPLESFVFARGAAAHEGHSMHGMP